MPEDVDIKRLLPLWIEERDALNMLIAWGQKKTGQGSKEVPAERRSRAALEPTAMPTLLESDTFFRMSVPNAIKSFLNISRRPRTAQDITDGLKRGGLTTKARNLYATVYPTLLRMEKAGEVVRPTKGEWGLANWYSGGRKANSEEKPEGEK
jgi:hypothetical protein